MNAVIAGLRNTLCAIACAAMEMPPQILKFRHGPVSGQDRLAYLPDTLDLGSTVAPRPASVEEVWTG